MKKIYAKPAMEVVETEIAKIVCTSPGGGTVNNVDTGDTGIVFGEKDPDNGTSVRGNYRGNSIWDD